MSLQITEAMIDTWSDTERRQVLGWLMKTFQRPKRLGARIKLLADMKVGDVLFVAEDFLKANSGYTRRRARQVLGVSDAEWQTRMTTKGRRITRIR